jgi:hypothetical protein
LAQPVAAVPTKVGARSPRLDEVTALAAVARPSDEPEAEPIVVMTRAAHPRAVTAKMLTNRFLMVTPSHLADVPRASSDGVSSPAVAARPRTAKTLPAGTGGLRHEGVVCQLFRRHHAARPPAQGGEARSEAFFKCQVILSWKRRPPGTLRFVAEPGPIADGWRRGWPKAIGGECADGSISRSSGMCGQPLWRSTTSLCRRNTTAARGI